MFHFLKLPVFQFRKYENIGFLKRKSSERGTQGLWNLVFLVSFKSTPVLPLSAQLEISVQ